MRSRVAAMVGFALLASACGSAVGDGPEVGLLPVDPDGERVEEQPGEDRGERGPDEEDRPPSPEATEGDEPGYDPDVDGDPPVRPSPGPAGPAQPPAAAPTSAPCPNYVAGPYDDAVGPASQDEADHRRVEEEQNRVTPDLHAAQQYAGRHPDAFAGIMYGNTPRVRVVVAFTRDHAAHCQALRDLLEYRDEFELRHGPYTDAYLAQVQNEVSQWPGLQGVVRSTGRYLIGPVGVQLRADAARPARELHEHFGSALDIQLGLHPYPASRLEGPAESCQRALTSAAGPQDGVAAEVVLDSSRLAPGQDGEGVLRVRNTGVEPVSVNLGPREGVVVAPGSRTVVGMSDPVAQPAIGYGDQRLAPGQSVDLPLRFGTAACDPAEGYALGPGEHAVLAAVEVRWEATGRTATVLARETPLTLA